MGQPKVVIIGLDAATFTLLTPWMEEGYLPNLKKILDNGVGGFLQSSILPVTFPAFQCFMTGKNPGKHGVSFFLRYPQGSYGWILVDSTKCDGRTLWELLGDAGKRVAVVNVPGTYPPQAVNGVMISGFAPGQPEKQNAVYPPELLEELKQRFDNYLPPTVAPWMIALDPTYIGNFLDNCRAVSAYQFQVASYLMERHAVDFLMLHITVTDKIQHSLWHLLDPTHPKYNSQEAEQYTDKIVGYYRDVDSHIGKLAEQAGPEATIIIFSDHGAGPFYRCINLNAWLLREGYIKIKPKFKSQFKHFLWRKGWTPAFSFFSCLTPAIKLASKQVILKSIQKRIERNAAGSRNTGRRRKLTLRALKGASRVFLSFNDIDWIRTKAYALPGGGQIKINLAGREPQGSVQPGREYEALQEELVMKLQSLTDPASGAKVNSRVFVKEEIYHGPYLDELPDITYLPHESGYQPNEAPDVFVTNKVFTDSIISPETTGIHRQEGILLIKGKELRRQVWLEGANIMDVAPTILHLMGCKVPRDMDGRVLTELFTEEWLQAHPIAYAEPVASEHREGAELSRAEEEAMLKALKDLGYIA